MNGAFSMNTGRDCKDIRLVDIRSRNLVWLYLNLTRVLPELAELTARQDNGISKSRSGSPTLDRDLMIHPVHSMQPFVGELSLMRCFFMYAGRRALADDVNTDLTHPLQFRFYSGRSWIGAIRWRF